jgi:hypothetical protein
MSQVEACTWIKEHHKIELSRKQYEYTCMKIDTKAGKRKKKFMLEGIYKKQIEAIDRIEKIMQLSFKNAQNAIDDGQYRTAQFIYNSIIRQQEILTSYYDEIQDTIEYDTDQEKKMEDSAETQRIEDLNGFFATGTSRGHRHLTGN